MTNLTAALRAALTRHNMKQIDLAKNLEIGTGEMTRIFQGKPPADKVFLKICCKDTWHGCESTAKSILKSHLHDEIQRSGYSPADFLIKETGEEEGLTTDLIFLIHSAAQTLKKIQKNEPAKTEDKKTENRPHD